MIYSIKDETNHEVKDNRLRNEIIFSAKINLQYTDYEGTRYHIEKMPTERVGFKEIRIRKDENV